jgi:hypothetical protein
VITKTQAFFLNLITRYGKKKTIEIRAYLGIEEKVPVRVPKSKDIIENIQ